MQIIIESKRAFDEDVEIKPSRGGCLCAAAFEKRGPMWSFVDPVTHQVEVHIRDESIHWEM